jgi:hypothetical protein
MSIMELKSVVPGNLYLTAEGLLTRGLRLEAGNRVSGARLA